MPTLGSREPVEQCLHGSSPVQDGVTVDEQVGIGRTPSGRLVVRTGKADVLGQRQHLDAGKGSADGIHAAVLRGVVDDHDVGRRDTVAR